MGKKEGTPYYLRDNPFKDDGTFIAQAVCRRNADLNAVIDRMVDKGTTLTEVDLRAVITLFRDAIINLISEGAAINIDNFISIRSTIGGVFTAYDEKFEPTRHQYKLKMLPSVRFMTDLLKEVSVERIEKSEKVPLIKLLHDMATDTFNKSLTAGNIVRIEGKNLSFNRAEEDEGIYIYNKGGDRFIKVNFRNKSNNKELHFLVPPDVATLGEEVYIMIKTRYGTKILRDGKTMFLLKVMPAQG